MLQPPSVFAELKMLCRQIAPTSIVHAEGYRSTPNQIYFFTLVWLLNQEKKKFARPIQINLAVTTDLHIESLDVHIRHVAHHLSRESAEIVTRLQNKDAQMWYVLADLLMRNAGKGFDCPQPIKEDAAANGLEKIVRIMNQMADRCASHLLDTHDNLNQLAEKLCTDQVRIYDFRTHFYNFVQWIVRNDLISLLRKDKYEVSLEPFEEFLVGNAPDDILSVSEKNIEMRQQLKEQLGQLLSALPSLTEKRLLVILHTLAARPQFWLALELAGLNKPTIMPHSSMQPDDESIGLKLNMTASNVRAHRSNGYTQLRKEQPKLAELLLTLMKVNLIDWELDLSDIG